MVVGPAKVLLMDSISTGLDSSTTFLIVSCLRNFCHFMDATVCISLLQPPPGEAGRELIERQATREIVNRIYFTDSERSSLTGLLKVLSEL